MSVLKKLASDTALYGVSTMLGRMLNYLLVLLHTNVFKEPQALGPQSELYAYVGVCFVIYALGMETGFFRFGSKSEEDKRRYYDAALTAVMCVSILFSGLIIVFAKPLASFLHFDNDLLLFHWFAVILAIDAICSIPFARLRLEKKAHLFVKARIINIFLNIFLNIFFLVICRDIHQQRYLTFLKPFIDLFYDPTLGAKYIVLANLLANFSFLWHLRKQFFQFWPNFDKKLLLQLWVYSYPILIMNLAAVINMMADRILLKWLLPESYYVDGKTDYILGVYGQCYKLSIFMNLVIQAFKYGAEPFFFSEGNNKNAPETFALVMKWFFIACILLWVGVSLNLDILANTFLQGSKYHEGLAIVPFLLLAFLFLGVYYNLTAWFKLTDKTHYGTYITIMGAASTLILNIILVPQMGYIASPIAFASSSFLMMAVCYILGQKHYPVPYDVKSFVFYVVSAGILIWVVYPLKFDSLWISVPFHLALFILYSLIVLIIERNSLPTKIRQKLKFLPK